jgi:Fe-S-cluster containining protein
MSKTSRRLQAAFAKLDALYAQLPTIVCRGECAIACGAIPLTDLEARRLHLVSHKAPRTVPGFKAVADFVPSDLLQRCVYLTPHDRCSVYDVRPLMCRAWGLVKAMSCMHGCLPDRWLKDLEFVRLAQAIEKIAGGRMLRTAPTGLVQVPGESYLGLRRPDRSEAAIERISERTRNLRALHGGHIIVAVDETDE